jgi:hypothetical protein
VVLIYSVIASVAKQSMPPQAVEWIASFRLRSLSYGGQALFAIDGVKFRQPDYTPPG